jgi:hypothetical protein
MLFQILSRLLSVFVISIVCSVPVSLNGVFNISDNDVLFISFMMFVLIMGIDAYNFSYNFWMNEDYFKGQLLPFVIYVCLAYFTCLTFRPVVFNKLFLPLRFARAFGLSTVESITVISLVLIILITVLRFLGMRSAKTFFNINEDEDNVFFS